MFEKYSCSQDPGPRKAQSRAASLSDPVILVSPVSRCRIPSHSPPQVPGQSTKSGVWVSSGCAAGRLGPLPLPLRHPPRGEWASWDYGDGSEVSAH